MILIRIHLHRLQALRARVAGALALGPVMMMVADVKKEITVVNGRVEAFLWPP